MKRIGNLFAHIVAPETLHEAWLAFRRGKRSRASVHRFEKTAPGQIEQLHRDLVTGTYRPSQYRTRVITRPKARLIAAAPVRDRVVHHAVHRALAPVFDPSLIEHTYACLPGRGTHRALIQFVRNARRYRHVLLLDIRHYFLSMDHDIIHDLMARRLKDKSLLALLDRIARSSEGLYRDPAIAARLGLPAGFPPPGRGLAIGNLTSQWWGNHYLSGLDHHARRTLKIPHVQRYMDDSALFSNDARQLAEARDDIAHWLHVHRGLRLKNPKARVRDTGESFIYLGMRVSRSGMAARAEAMARMERRLNELALCGTREALERSTASFAGTTLQGWLG
ncbi:MAG: RNA-dependent DNA polymerase [Proteobacteria bacterium]|nr:RNA-dependent DNA polymerase [Pseudomonadota bacterium]